MNHTIKKNIRLLAEKYNHSVEYDKELLRLKNRINNITIIPVDKYNIKSEYNIEEGIQEIEFPQEDIYDILIELFRRKEKETVKPKGGELLNLDLYVKEEGIFAHDRLQSLSQELIEKPISYKGLGGNRIEAEYFKGIIVLTDDLMFLRSNVIEYK